MSRSPGWRLRTEHVTAFEYGSPARSSFNEVRKSPLPTSRQTVHDARVMTTPGAPQYAYRDYWGSAVVAFNVDLPHDQLVVHGVSTAETHEQRRGSEASWAAVGAAANRMAELVAETELTRADDALRGIADELRAGTPATTAAAVVDWVHRALGYVPGVTHVRTSALEAYREGQGVCQDFAHLALAVLRAAGLPARYVSGYLHPEPDPVIGEPATGESHAWVEAWTGYWWGLDPANGSEVGHRHVEVARGRDYADVPPVRGVYAGGGDIRSTVTVTITRVA